MLPVILQIGPLTITTYGIALAIGFFFASFQFWQRGREEHFEETHLMDCIIICALVGLLFSRIYFLILNLNKFSNAWQFFDFVGIAGFSYQGALFGGILSLFLYSRWYKWDFLVLADIATFGIIIAQVFANLGLFLSSSYFNTLNGLLYFVKFAIFIALFFFFQWLSQNYRTFEWYKDKRGEANPGFLFFSFLFLSSLLFLLTSFVAKKNIAFDTKAIVNVIIILASAVGFLIQGGKSPKLEISIFKKRKVKPGKSRFKTGLEAK